MSFPEIFQSILEDWNHSVMPDITDVSDSYCHICLVLLLITGWQGKVTGNMVAVQCQVQLDPLVLSQAQTCYESWTNI